MCPSRLGVAVGTSHKAIGGSRCPRMGLLHGLLDVVNDAGGSDPPNVATRSTKRPSFENDLSKSSPASGVNTEYLSRGVTVARRPFRVSLYPRPFSGTSSRTMAWGKVFSLPFSLTYGSRVDCFDSLCVNNKKRPAFVLAVLWSPTESLEYLMSPSLRRVTKYLSPRMRADFTASADSSDAYGITGDC